MTSGGRSHADGAMTFTTALWALIAAVVIGVAALCTNPARHLNRMAAAVCAHFALWAWWLHQAFTHPTEALWRQGGAITAAGLIWHWWMWHAGVLYPAQRRTQHLRASWPWLAGWAVLALIILLGDALRSASPAVVYGPAYYWFAGGYFVSAGILMGTAYWRMRGLDGGRRLDGQLLILGGALGAVCGLAMATLDPQLPDAGLMRLMPIVVVLCVGGTIWAVTTSRILNAKHIMMLGLERIGLVATVALFVWGLQEVAERFMPGSAAFVLALAIGLWIAAEIAPWFDELFQRQARRNRIRHAAFEVARENLRPDAMGEAYLQLLREWAGCERVLILMGANGRLTGDGIEFAADSPEMKLLGSLRWITPERLERERPTPERKVLGELLAKHQLGVLVSSIGPSPAFVVGLGEPYSRRPYTYPEIGLLLQLAAIIENSLSRAHYLLKTQHAEQLATVGMLGASIAHEIRNPLVSIKTFVQLLPDHYQEPAFRDKFFRLIGDEVGRIDRLTEQLLDLSAPRVFTAKPVEVHPLLTSCLDLLVSKAEDKGISLLTDFSNEADCVFTDPNAIKQVMLNLGFNAIQALEKRQGERWIRFVTRKLVDSVEIAVEDNGPGFTPEVWARLFQPFQSTKSSGFGLGLAICKDILSSLQASISADPPESGRGATFRIVLPCPPSPTS